MSRRKTSRRQLPEVLDYIRALGRPATLTEIAAHLDTIPGALHWIRQCNGSVRVDDTRPSAGSGGNPNNTYDVVSPNPHLTAHWPGWKGNP
jgi:hypothetical protein